MTLSSRRGLPLHSQWLFFSLNHPVLIIHHYLTISFSFVRGVLQSAYALSWLPAFALWRYGVASWRDRPPLQSVQLRAQPLITPCASAYAPTVTTRLRAMALWRGKLADRLTGGRSGPQIDVVRRQTRAICEHYSRSARVARHGSKLDKNSKNPGRDDALCSPGTSVLDARPWVNRYNKNLNPGRGDTPRRR
jgi:hypothetical protein